MWIKSVVTLINDSDKNWRWLFRSAIEMLKFLRKPSAEYVIKLKVTVIIEGMMVIFSKTIWAVCKELWWWFASNSVVVVTLPPLTQCCTRSTVANEKFFKCVRASDNYLNYVKEFDCSVSKTLKMGLEQFWIGYYSAL